MAVVAALALLATLASAAAPPVQTNTSHAPTEIQLEDSLVFVPSLIAVEPGDSVSLILINVGQITHTFTLYVERDPSVPLGDNTAFQAYNQAQTKIKDVTLGPGEQTQIQLTAPSAAGTYIFVCTEPGHAVGGMHGVLSVGTPPGDGGISGLTVGIAIAVGLGVIVVVALFLLKKRGR